MLSCRQVLDELGNYLDDEVAAGLKRDLEAHLADCRVCTVIFDSTRRTLRLVTDSRSFEMPEAIARGIMARIRAEGRTP